MSKEELKPIDVSKYTVTESGNVIKDEEKETTNKELEKRAFAEADKVVIGKGMDRSSVVHLRHLLKNMYVNGAISETALLSQHILELQADKGNLTDKVKELEAQIEKMKSQYNYAFNQLCESREIVCLMLSQYKNKKEIDYSTRERGEKLLKQGVYKYD